MWNKAPPFLRDRKRYKIADYEHKNEKLGGLQEVFGCYKTNKRHAIV